MFGSIHIISVNGADHHMAEFHLVWKNKIHTNTPVIIISLLKYRCVLLKDMCLHL